MKRGLRNYTQNSPEYGALTGHVLGFKRITLFKEHSSHIDFQMNGTQFSHINFQINKDFKPEKKIERV